MASMAGLLRILFEGREDGIRARFRRRQQRTEAAPPPAAAPEPVSGRTVVLKSSELEEGDLVEVMVPGREDPIVLCRVEGEVHGVSAVCPHAGGPLGDGALDGHTLTCPLHGWGFDVRDGRCLVDEDSPVATVQVVEKDGSVAVVDRRS